MSCLTLCPHCIGHDIKSFYLDRCYSPYFSCSFLTVTPLVKATVTSLCLFYYYSVTSSLGATLFFSGLTLSLSPSHVLTLNWYTSVPPHDPGTHLFIDKYVVYKELVVDTQPLTRSRASTLSLNSFGLKIRGCRTQD